MCSCLKILQIRHQLLNAKAIGKGRGLLITYLSTSKAKTKVNQVQGY